MMSNPFHKAKPSGLSASVVVKFLCLFWVLILLSILTFLVFCCVLWFLSVCLTLSLSEFALVFLTHKQNIPSAERRGGG